MRTSASPNNCRQPIRLCASEMSEQAGRSAAALMLQRLLNNVLQAEEAEATGAGR